MKSAVNTVVKEISEASGAAPSLTERAQNMARVAAEHAAAVDGQARFPEEAFRAAKDERLLGMQVPVALGGDGASVAEVADVCYILGRACASTAMIFAMHQIMVAILVRHAQSSAWHNQFMRRIASEQLLVASSTTENQTGGDVRSSSCSVNPEGARFNLTKNATVMSYGAQADAILTTARRAADAAQSDQVLVALLKEDYRLDPIVAWNTMGMRGTCSTGFTLTGSGLLEQVLPGPYEKIHVHSMMPIAHLTWGAVWTGAAADAVARARQFVRNAARHSGGQLPPGAAHMTRALLCLRTLRALLSASVQRFEKAGTRGEVFESLDFQTAFNLLKVNASEQAIATVMTALQACGLSGYRNDGEFSISRNLRDVLSSSIMINNDRILANAASASLLVDIPTHLED
jgi:acyl-CoA dehydrogenase